MLSSFHNSPLRLTHALLAAAVLAVTGCSSTVMNSANPSSGATGPEFVVATDMPLASIVSFQVQIASIDAIDSNNNSVPLLSGQPTVDFARYNGLQALMSMNSVKAGTYNSVTITLSSQNASVGYLNTSGAGAPTIQTATPTFTTTTANVTLAKPFTVVQGGSPVGLRVDFDLHKSITIDASGNISVTPTLNVSAVANNDNGGHIDELDAGVVSVDSSAQSFLVQRADGLQITINVNGQTEWDGDASFAALNSSSIVEVAGSFDKASLTLDADEVAILSDSNFYAAGQVTYVTPPTGTATSFDLYVRGLLPTNTGLTLGQVAQVNLTGNEKFFIYWMHNPFTEFLFNSSAMVAGQAVAVGGPATGAANAGAVTVNRVTLRNWGFNGTVVPGSQQPGQASFQMQVNGFAGVLIPETITVYLGGNSDFRYGLGAFSDINDNLNLRVVGLLLKNPTTGQVVLLARHVDGLDLTDTATAAFE
jgi:hypothetical protein